MKPQPSCHLDATLWDSEQRTQLNCIQMSDLQKLRWKMYTVFRCQFCGNLLHSIIKWIHLIYRNFQICYFFLRDIINLCLFRNFSISCKLSNFCHKLFIIFPYNLWYDVYWYSLLFQILAICIFFFVVVSFDINFIDISKNQHLD